jgi:hypothetical protein
MKRFLQEGIEASKKIGGGPFPSRPDRRARLEVESLEDRTALFSTPLLIAPGMSTGLVEHLAHRLHLFIPSLAQSQLNPSALVKLAHGLHLNLAAPDLAGVSFHLDSLTYPGNAHELDIYTETYNPDGTAEFTGQWGDVSGLPKSDEPLLPGAGHPLLYGHMMQNEFGTFTVFSWAEGRYFLGYITRPGAFWHIEGNTNAGPLEVVGYEIA